MAKKAAPKVAQGKAATPPAAKAVRGKATPAPAAKAATGKAAPAPATKVAPAPAAKAAPAPAAKAPPKPADTPTPDRPKPANRAVVYTALAETTGLGKKQVAAVFAALGELIGKELGQKGPGRFILPGFLKLTVVHKPATKARSRTNPFTGAPMTIAAKPARNVVRALPLKALKEMV
jgi:nucleoid DNA-binding protein